MKDLEKVLMNFIHLTNYGINEIKLNNYSISFLESKSKIMIKENENHNDYLFRIFDEHFSN
jgi:hypothetical protein